MSAQTTRIPTRDLAPGAGAPACRICAAPLHHTFVDLGMSPLCESYLPPERLDDMEPFYPLHVRVCERCFLVQLDEYVAPEDIFTEYAYFSAYSDSWVAHARRYVDEVVERFELTSDSFVVEVASNDGYLLQHFDPHGVPVLGFEPAANVAEAAVARGIPTHVEFLGLESGRRVAAEHGRADLVVANNVFAHVPNLGDFTAGLAALLKPTGVLTLEFPHLLRLIERHQFDTIYHEHFSYHSFHTAQLVLADHGLTVFDVEELDTHGGSLRVFARPDGDDSRPVGERVRELRVREEELGVTRLETYERFGPAVAETKQELLTFLIEAKRAAKTIVGYGAPGKGNTLLNYCGIRTDFLDFTVDRNPYKQGLFLPGTHIPIHHPDAIVEARPDYVLILPWNVKDEIVAQLARVREWGGQFIVPIPKVEVL